MYIYLSRRIKISVTFMMTLIFLLVRMVPSYSFCVLFAIIVHELGHIILIRLCGGIVVSLTVRYVGADIRTRGVLPYRAEVFTSAAGAAVNLLLGAVLSGEASAVNLLYGALNLLPVSGLDGGKILSSLLLMRLPPHISTRICRAVSEAFLFVMYQVGLFIFLKTSSNMTLFLLSCYLFISSHGDDKG